jgi:hypothetical protein
MTPKKPVLGRVWQIARGKGKGLASTFQRELLICSFGDFLRRRHVAFPSKISYYFFVSQTRSGAQSTRSSLYCISYILLELTHPIHTSHEFITFISYISYVVNRIKKSWDTMHMYKFTFRSVRTCGFPKLLDCKPHIHSSFSIFNY